MIVKNNIKALQRGLFWNLLEFCKDVSYAGVAVFLAVMHPYTLEGLYGSRLTLCEL